MRDDFLRRARLALHDMQGRVESGKLAMFEQTIEHAADLEAEVERLRRDLMSARDCAVEAENERDDAKAEIAALREARGVVLETLPPECAPKGCPVLVAGGIAMKKTGGQWYSGMAEPAFERPITWEVKWWAPIPDQNDLSALSPAPVSVGEATGGGIAAITAERQRQKDAEGWTPEHDDAHGEAVLARAGACYAVYGSRIEGNEPPSWWPFNPLWWKPKNRRADLVRAGALIAAEIDRLDRAALRALSETEGE